MELLYNINPAGSHDGSAKRTQQSLCRCRRRHWGTASSSAKEAYRFVTKSFLHQHGWLSFSDGGSGSLSAPGHPSFFGLKCHQLLMLGTFSFFFFRRDACISRHFTTWKKAKQFNSFRILRAVCRNFVDAHLEDGTSGHTGAQSATAKLRRPLDVFQRVVELVQLPQVILLGIRPVASVKPPLVVVDGLRHILLQLVQVRLGEDLHFGRFGRPIPLSRTAHDAPNVGVAVRANVAHVLPPSVLAVSVAFARVGEGDPDDLLQRLFQERRDHFEPIRRMRREQTDPLLPALGFQVRVTESLLDWNRRRRKAGRRKAGQVVVVRTAGPMAVWWVRHFGTDHPRRPGVLKARRRSSSDAAGRSRKARRRCETRRSVRVRQTFAVRIGTGPPIVDPSAVDRRVLANDGDGRFVEESRHLGEQVGPVACRSLALVAEGGVDGPDGDGRQDGVDEQDGDQNHSGRPGILVFRFFPQLLDTFVIAGRLHC